MLGMRDAIDRLRSDLLGLRSTLGNDAGSEPPPPHY